MATTNATKDRHLPRLPTETPAWITPELVQHTMRLWSRYEPRPVTSEDAVEMILHVGELFEALGLTSADAGGVQP
ncbi:MAG: hypothetical protein LC104_11135 [Bacteroidales bacterium]|nr:hypothetical protein [Bacteroidales bacterium]